MDPREDEKRAAAEAAALLVEDGMAVGLGTGSTVAHFLPALAARGLDLRCVATSIQTEEQARALGLPIQPFDLLDRLDVAVDGADQVTPDLWLVKGGGGALTREKVVAAAVDRFVVIVSSDKEVDAVEPPIPMEVLSFGVAATLRRLGEIGPAKLRDAPPTPDGNLLVDYVGSVRDPADLSAALDAIPGVVEHGLFPPDLVSEVLVGRANGRVDRRAGR
ncbi:MAG TPA: ribose-5-phosphate isomerase RpiA [Actinomycetota bacterium]|nr:ribose-5-phosphate isomerase RpiA [Actinomycetota bacterium]